MRIQTSAREMANVPDVILNSDHRMPLVGFGTLAYPITASDSIKSAILHGINAGYRHFDMASLYQTEQALGEAIKEALELGLHAMEECQVLGLTKSIGANNFSSKKLEHILSVSTIPPAVNQVEISPVWQQNKLREFCQAKGIIVAANSPLGAKDTSWGTNRVMDSEVLSEIAKAKGKTHAQIYLRWAYEQGVCVVVKSFNEERIACLWHGLTSLIR
ncbi:hypothetical protein IFM89_027761 [Coptis chinensis]|uniref:NADP-dependent oxidoreductase domain-containing protein n=1 Tax=Coptis chinensis TaxID=261450 RepID=A0A835I5T0_9MAGN|nr:hypothetical protein IFM89_027761 [Coptis chinensis]